MLGEQVYQSIIMINNPKNRTFGLLREPNNDSEQPFQKIYPFYIKFTEGRTKSLWQPVTNDHPNSFQSTQPFITDPAISEMYQDDSFQSYHTLQNPLKVQQELSEAHLSQQKQQQEVEVKILDYQQPKLYGDEEEGEQDQYSHLSENQLRAINNKMVRKKQEMRRMITQLRKNFSILSQQNVELQRLKALREKALDYNYEFQLDQATSRKKSKSHLVQQSIQCMSNILKKQRYQRFKEFNHSKDPSELSRLMCNSRVTEISQHIPRMLCRREQMLCKRRREEKYASVLEVLTRKKEELEQINCIFDSRICMGDEVSLMKRKKELEELIDNRRKKQISHQEKLEKEILDITSHLQSVELKIIMTDVQIRNNIEQQPIRANHLSKVKKKVRCNNSEFSRRIQSVYCFSPKSLLSPKAKPNLKFPSKQSALGAIPFIPRKSTYRLISQQITQRQHTTN